MSPYDQGDFHGGEGGVNDFYPYALPGKMGQEGLVTSADLNLEIQVFVDFPLLANGHAFLGDFALNVKKEEQFRAGKALVKSFREFIAAGNALINKGRRHITVRYHKFTPVAAFHNAIRAVEVLIPVGGKEKSDCFRP